jgi:hypothetical protein
LALVSNIWSRIRAATWKQPQPLRAAAGLGTGTPVRLVATIGPVTAQDFHLEIPAMQIHDTEQFTLTLEAQDSKGFAVADTLTWTVDNPAVVSLQVSSDTMSATIVAGAPGSAVVTITDGTLTATEAVDVVPGAVAKLVLTEGPVTPQP